jgi:hypothetical protein
MKVQVISIWPDPKKTILPVMASKVGDRERNSTLQVRTTET